MGVNRGIFLLLFTLVSNAAFSQPGPKTFSFDKEPLPEAIRFIVESFELYVSYDPQIFVDQPKVSLDMETNSIHDALTQLLGDTFSFRIINEYVVINPKKRVGEMAEVSPMPKPKPIVYDTVVIHETNVFYDTVTVEEYEIRQVYDTTYLEKEVLIYDTITYYTKPKNDHHFLSYLAPTIWKRTDASLFGASLGLSYQYRLKNFYLELGIAYQYAQQNINFSKTETLTQLQVDTVSTFFIIENEQRIPVYIIDSTFTDSEVVREVDRTNALHQMSVALLLGKSFSVGKRLTLGINAGLSIDWVFRSDAIMDTEGSTEDGASQTLTYRFPLQNFRLELPLMYKGNSLSEGYFLAPFGELGLNSDFTSTDHSSSRYRFGLKVGVFF